MAARVAKIVCLVLLCAIFAGVFAGSQRMILWLLDTTVPTSPAPPSSTVTTPPATIPPTTQEPTRPTLPDPEPLPPGSGHTVQLSTQRKPAKPNVVIPKLSADDFFIFDTRIDDFLYISSQPDKAIYPASTTKLFTTFVALQYLQPEDVVTVGGELSYVQSDASVAGFRRGDKVSVEALAYSALLPSGCDASYILAAAAGRVILADANATAKNAITAFMAECNRLGQELGMVNTNFVTPDGYHHDDHRISLQAFVIIGKCSLENALIAQITASPSTVITYANSRGKTCTKELLNTNLTIHADSEYYNAHSIGLKTGFTDDAGNCLLTAFEVDGRYILVGVFNCRSSDSRFQDVNKLFHTYLPYL